MRSVPPIAFDYRFSRLLLSAVAGAVVLSLVAIAACGLNTWIRLAIGLATLAYAVRSLRDYARPPFDHIVWHSAGHWRLRAANAEVRAGDFVCATMLGSLIVLRLRIAPKQTITLPLLHDNCDIETRRRLRVRLARAIAPPRSRVALSKHGCRVIDT